MVHFEARLFASTPRRADVGDSHLFMDAVLSDSCSNDCTSYLADYTNGNSNLPTPASIDFLSPQIEYSSCTMVYFMYL